MAAINVTYVTVLNNPAPFLSPLLFEINYECLYDLPEDLEWKVTYVGSSENEEHDQVLETIYVGPVTVGQYQFQLEAPAPNPALIPTEEVVGVTALLLTCAYGGNEFVRVGYFVNNKYTDLADPNNPPEIPEPARLVREVMADNPRVTRFPIDFGRGLPEEFAPPGGSSADAMGDDGQIQISQDMTPSLGGAAVAQKFAGQGAVKQEHSPGSDQEAFTHAGNDAQMGDGMMA